MNVLLKFETIFVQQPWTLCIGRGLRQCPFQVKDDNIYLILEQSLIKGLLAKFYKFQHL